MYPKDSPEYEIIDELQPLPEELVLDKNSLNHSGPQASASF